MVGPLNMGQVIALGVAAGMLVLLAIQWLLLRRRPDEPVEEVVVPADPDDGTLPHWADPTERPRI